MNDHIPSVGAVAVFLLATNPIFAMWSVLDDDPRPRNPRHTFEVFLNEDWNKSTFATNDEIQWFRNAK